MKLTPDNLAGWDRRGIQGGGDHMTFIARDGRAYATLVRLPGTQTRIYWPSGMMCDHVLWDEAVADVERRYAREQHNHDQHDQHEGGAR